MKYIFHTVEDVSLPEVIKCVCVCQFMYIAVQCSSVDSAEEPGIAAGVSNKMTVSIFKVASLLQTKVFNADIQYVTVLLYII